MKKITFLLFVITSITFVNSPAQSLKLKNWAFRYEYLPENPLPINTKTYKIENSSDATDGVTQSYQFSYIGEDYIHGYKNISVVYVKNGVMVGGFVIGGKSDEKKPEETPDLQISIILNNIEMLDKKDFIIKRTTFRLIKWKVFIHSNYNLNFHILLKLKM